MYSMKYPNKGLKWAFMYVPELNLAHQNQPNVLILIRQIIKWLVMNETMND